MPRVNHVKKARKDVKDTDIKAGDSYYWWKFRYGGKRYSKTPPRPSQLTQSEFLSTVYDIQEEIEGLPADDSLPGAVEDIVSRLRDLASECEEKKSNMPDALQDGDTGQMLQDRADACEAAADELEGIDLEDWTEDEEATKEERVDDPDAPAVNADGKTEEDYWAERLEEVQAVSIDV